MSQEKISAVHAAQVYSEVPGVLRALVTERNELLEKNAALSKECAAFERRDRIEKIARSMHDKGVNPSSSLEEKADQIKEAAERGRSLDVIEEAIEMTAPNGALAKLAEEQPGNGATQLEAYLLGGLSD
jgi:hypothetical protein